MMRLGKEEMAIQAIVDWFYWQKISLLRSLGLQKGNHLEAQSAEILKDSGLFVALACLPLVHIRVCNMMDSSRSEFDYLFKFVNDG
ncbi:hypothetical protein Tco_1361327 [Tanacetum coccineum]